MIHGYTGSPENLAPLAAVFAGHGDEFAVRLVRLHEHTTDQVPLFEKDKFITAVAEAASGFKEQGKPVVIIGHSTGGSLALAAIGQAGIVPDLLILASVPKEIDAASFTRWEKHREGKQDIPFSSVAAMVSCINSSGANRYGAPFPVLVLHGGQDELAPASQARLWKKVFSGPVRTVVIPGAGHDLFRDENSRVAVDLAVRSAADALNKSGEDDKTVLDAICSVEPEAAGFLVHSPGSARHLAASPSGRSSAGRLPELNARVNTEPILANVEITTKCNLRCGHCARTLRKVAGEDMPLETFVAILGLLPHAYRITLVGLGETLLHPNVVDFVAEASSQGRRVALVTNGVLLDDRLCRELLSAGLESIAFSIDGATREVASKARPGADLDRVIENVKRFVSISRSTREVSIAVFSAVSAETVSSLDSLTGLISGLGVHVLMLSDLNFRENLADTLWKNIDEQCALRVRAAVAAAFKKGLPVLSVRGLEEFGLWKRYSKFLLLPPDQLYQRSDRRAWCCSPWQTVPVNVRGEVPLCDCQPETDAGNLLTRPLSEIWNGGLFMEHRSRMLGS